MEDLIIQVITYNVATVFPSTGLNLSRLLGLEDSPGENSRPDIYVIGCQEIKSQPQNMVYDTLFDDPWMDLFKRTLAPLGYVRLRSVRLQGIVLAVLVRRPLLVRVRDTEQQLVRLGLGGMWGNKGAVALRLSLSGVNLCLVNAHLTAHDHLLEDRVRNYSDILDQANFQEPATSKLLYHDYLIWLGDLNFRLHSSPSLPSDAAARRLASDHDLTPLLELDQLRAVQRKGEAFAEMSEPTLTFKPTYKMVPGRRGEYNVSRRPAWTDRVLYKVNADVYDGTRLAIEPLSYQSHPEYTDSDHQPVSAAFRLKVFPGRVPPCVEFLPVSVWLIGADCVAKYRLEPGLEVSAWDWIGLFRADFASLDEYLSYIWVPRASSSPHSDHYVAVFPEDSVTMPGSYVLVYFGRNGRGVYGISEPFSVQYSHSARLAALSLAPSRAERRPLLEAAEEAAEAAQEAAEAVQEAVERAAEGRPVADVTPERESPPAGRELGGVGVVPAGAAGVCPAGEGVVPPGAAGVCPPGEGVVPAGADGVPRRRLVAASEAAEPPPEGWEKLERPEGTE